MRKRAVADCTKGRADRGVATLLLGQPGPRNGIPNADWQCDAGLSAYALCKIRWLIDSWAVRYYCLKTLHGLKRLASPGEAPRQRVDLIVMAAGVCRRTAVVFSLFFNSTNSHQWKLP